MLDMFGLAIACIQTGNQEINARCIHAMLIGVSCIVPCIQCNQSLRFQEVLEHVHILVLGSTILLGTPFESVWATPRFSSRQGTIKITSTDELIAIWQTADVFGQLTPNLSAMPSRVWGAVVSELIYRHHICGPFCKMQTNV